MSKDTPVRCPACNKAMQNEALVVDDQFFHPDCLKCTGCSKKFAESESSYVVSGKVVCKACFGKKHAQKCSGCSKEIVEGEVIQLFDKGYHAKCAPKCDRCSKPPTDKQYSSFENKLYCVECAWMTLRDQQRAKMEKEKEKVKTQSPGSAVPAK